MILTNTEHTRKLNPRHRKGRAVHSQRTPAMCNTGAYEKMADEETVAACDTRHKLQDPLLHYTQRHV